MRRLLFLGLLIVGHMPTDSLSCVLNQGQTLPPKISQPPQSQDDLVRLVAERDRLMKEQRFQDALPLAKRIVAMLRLQGPGGMLLGYALDSLAQCLFWTGATEDAESSWEEALVIFRAENPRSVQVSAVENSLGVVAWARGDYETSRRRHASALEGAKGTPLEAQCLQNLGNVAFQLGELDEAQVYYELSLQSYSRREGGALQAASVLTSMATLSMRRGDLEVAAHRLEQALLIKRSRAPGSITLAYSLSMQGNLAWLRRDLEGARRIFSEAYQILESQAPNSMQRIMILVNLAACEESVGDLAAARIKLKQALDWLDQHASGSLERAFVLEALACLDHMDEDFSGAHKGHLAALTLMERIAPLSLEKSRVLNNLASVFRDLADEAELQRVLTRRFDFITLLLKNQGWSDSNSIGAFGQEANQAMLRLGWLQDPSDFYPWLPTLRAAGLTLQTRAKISEREAESDENVRRARSAVQIATKQETDWATNPRPKELDDKAWNDKLLELRSARQSAELKLATLLKEKDPRLTGDLKINLQDVQRNLAKDAALVEYLRISTWDDKAKKVGQDAYGAFVVNRQGPVKFVRLGDAEEIDKLVADFMARVNADSSADRAQPVGPAPKPTEGKSREELGKELYRKLIAPLGKLPAILQIAPDSSLHGLAFDALQDVRGRYLLELKSVSLVGSGRDLAVRPPTAPAGPAVVFGVGTFQADLAARERPVAAKTEPSAAATRGQRGGSVWGSLPGAVEEAREVASRLGVEPILDSQAIEERLIGVKNPSVLHLATHGFSFPPAFEAPKRDRMEGLSLGERFGSADNPMLRSGIVLSGANDEEKLRSAGYLDGWVTALDLSLMDLRGTELVVLSACDTGLGDVRQSEGVFGLQRALRFAGAQTLVMSLFEVPDASTASLMKDFYGAWRPGSAAGTKQSALRAAKLKLLKDPKTRSPKNWAGFVLLGDR